MVDISIVLSISAIAAALVAPQAAHQDIKLKVTAPQQKYPNTESIVLAITIENTGADTATTEAPTDPPIGLLILDDRGRSRIIDGPAARRIDRRPRRPYILKPSEPRLYETRVPALLRPGQSLAKLGPGELQIQVLLPWLYYDERGRAQVELIKSNTIRISVEE